MYANMTEVKLNLLKQHYEAQRKRLVKRASYAVGEFFGEDVVQEAFAKAIRYIDKFPDDPDHFANFFNVLFYNEIKDFRADRLDKVELMEWHWESGEFDDERIANAELKRIEAELDKLKPDSRSIVYTVLWQGVSQKETAKAFGVPEGTVNSLVHRFRERVT